MGRKGAIILQALLLASLPAAGLSAKEPSESQDSLVRLVRARSVQIITDDDDRSFRKAVDATFLHNGTYMVCDTAFWRVDDNIINAFGHVSLSQENTILTSDRMDYLVEEDLAQFRGSVVELKDKDLDLLRTRYLDYNTSDSTAVFYNGASLKDKDGQIIESDRGEYDSRSKVFTFYDNVNMFTDTVYIRTSSLEYHSDTDEALFTSYIDFWREGNMLSAAGGWYSRRDSTFFFTGSVHATSANQEAWSDSLYYYQGPGDILMLGDAQVQDSSRRIAALAGYILYEDTLSKVTMMREAAVSIATDNATTHQTDTVYFGADTLVYNTVKMCDIDPSVKSAAEKRVKDFEVDPVSQYRAKAAQNAAASSSDDGDRPGQLAAAPKKAASVSGKAAVPEADVPKPEETDEETQTEPADTSAVAADSLAAAPPPDTTKVGFAEGYGHVKVFREDIQVRSDRMRYTDLDSIARFYETPMVWNEGNREYTSDSLFCLIRGGRVTQASLLSNAFITTFEQEDVYDQIKGPEVMAYFDTSMVLRRFDALGGATAVFFLMENDSYSTVNKVESKMISALFNEGQLEKVFYYDSPKNDAYPIVQFPKSDRTLKGFVWTPELRPAGKSDITTLSTKPSERMAYARHPRTRFPHTDLFFPGYMKGVRESLGKPKVREDEKVRRDHELKAGKVDVALPVSVAPADSAAAPADTVAAPSDSLAAVSDSLFAASDSLAAMPSDSLAQADTAAAQPDSVRPAQPTRRELRLAAAEKRRAERLAARDARWAELDKRDAEREAQHGAKKAARRRERTRKALIDKQKQDMKDAAKLLRYIEKYRKQYEKEQQRKNRSDSLQRGDGPSDDGDILGRGSLPRFESGSGVRGGHPDSDYRGGRDGSPEEI